MIVFTEKDKEILSIIDNWYYLTIYELEKILNVKYVTARVRLERLYSFGLVKKTKLFNGYMAYVSKKKKTLNINMGTYYHDVVAKLLAVHLKDVNDCEYLTIKQLRQEMKLMRYPDFALYKGQYIFIEVELHKKSKRVLNDVFRRYKEMKRQGIMARVIYYVPTETMQKSMIKEIAENNCQDFIFTMVLDKELMEYASN